MGKWGLLYIIIYYYILLNIIIYFIIIIVTADMFDAGILAQKGTETDKQSSSKIIKRHELITLSHSVVCMHAGK